jgi:CHRD domain
VSDRLGFLIETQVVKITRRFNEEAHLMMLRMSLVATAVTLAVTSSAIAHQFRFSAPLTGLDEATHNSSPATGSALVTIDEDEITMRVQVSFDGLVGQVTGADVYAVTGEPFTGSALPVAQDATADPPTAMLPDFPLGGISDSYDRTIDLSNESSYDPAFISTYGGTGFDRVSKSLNALIAGLNSHQTYLNITTSTNPEGEIRGFLVYLLGDYNNNGVVDAADYIVWRDSLGQSGEGLDADGDNSNAIDGADYLAWQQNFGRSRMDVTPGSGNGAAVPEPSTMTAVAAACVALLFRWRR